MEPAQGSGHRRSGDEEEPPFQAEWSEAHSLLEVTARTCISMLAASLKLYMRTRLAPHSKSAPKLKFEAGALVGGYRLVLDRLGIDWTKCPADLGVIEQVLLARNLDQHPEWIWTFQVPHCAEDLKKHPRPFFFNKDEAYLLDLPADSIFRKPSAHVSPEKLMRAISEVERFCEWVEAKAG